MFKLELTLASWKIPSSLSCWRSSLLTDIPHIPLPTPTFYYELRLSGMVDRCSSRYRTAGPYLWPGAIWKRRAEL